MVNVDLSLASSYIPAFVCIGKSILTTLLIRLLTPIGGIPIIMALVMIDRLLFNSDHVIDVNCIVSFTTALAYLSLDRIDYVTAPLPLHYFLGICWSSLGFLQSQNLIRLQKSWELISLGVMGAILGSLQSPLEPPTLFLTRSCGYTCSVLAQAYTRQEEDHPMTLIRNAVIFLAPLPISSVLMALIAISTFIQGRKLTGNSINSSFNDPQSDTEAQLLREALATRKSVHAQ